MSKRKAGVNDIIYELDNDDIEISSEDETKNAKYKRLDAESTIDLIPDIHDDNSCTKQKYISLDSNEDEIKGTHLCTDTHNGGKTSLDSIPFNGNINLINDSTKGQETDEINNGKLVSSDGNKTTIFNEDIDIDSPTSISDLGVVGCENRTPLISVRFRDKKLAANYKRQLKTFMLNLIKLHENELSDLDNETDIELDIWPEDLNDDEFECEENNEQNGLFFVDTAPCSNTVEEVPAYTQVSALISNKPDKAPSPPPLLRRTPLCFNCDGAHQLRDCRLPRNNARIAEKRKSIVRVGRYHIEDEQKYGHLTPGRISGGLRHALGLKRHELPLYIYRMRVLGYPPGWLEEARISHSGITMFDSSGTAIQDPEEEEGEVCEPGSKDKFDIKKILDFPGFNVPASSRYKEEGHLLGMPPISEQDSKIAMLQMLAPNAMKAYKRKKLTLFPSSENNTSIQETAEMELDSGDEEAEFPTVPPLPDEEPPLPQAPPPPPQAPPPDSPPLPPGTELDNDDPVAQKTDSADEKSADDLEVLEVIKVKDIPVPQDEMITIDDDDEDKFQVSSGRGSPTLDDLELKKRALLSALEGELGSKDNETKEGTENNGNETIDDKTLFDECVDVPIDDSDPSLNDSNDKEKLDTSGVFSNDNDATEVKETVNDATEVKETVNEALEVKETTNDALEVKETANNPTEAKETVNDEGANVDTDLSIMTPENKTGRVKNTSYGTPVMNIASSYVKLPSDDKFAKDICDVINFENLPNSTGKYKKICDLLKKVKNEVDRIQDS